MKNGKYLDSLSKDKKSKILKNIASHYRISVAEAEDEVRNDDAEMLYEYIANDQSLKMNVYNDMERGKMAKGGNMKSKAISKFKVGDFIKKKGSNLELEVLEIGNDWRSGKDFITINNDVTNQKKTLVDWSEYELIKMAKGGAVSKSEKEKLSNIAYQLQNCSDSWISKNHGKFVEMQNEYKKQFKKVYGHTNYADPNTMAKGGFVGKGEMVWKKLSSSDKINFLYENFTPQITPRSQELLVGKAWNFLPKNVKIKFEAKYANMEDYAKGGKTASPKPKMVRTQFEEEEFEYGNGGLLSGFNYSIGGL